MSIHLQEKVQAIYARLVDVEERLEKLERLRAKAPAKPKKRGKSE